jgi:hypothetical protein
MAMVINPMQEELVKQIQGIIEYNGYDASELYFAPLIPFGFLAELQGEAGDENAQEIIENPNDVPDLEGVEPDPNEGDVDTDNPNEIVGNVTPGPQGFSKQDWNSWQLDHNYEISK